MTITRQQYLNNTKLHNEYYAQFVTEEIKQLVLRRFGIEKLCAAYEEDTDLNSIPLVNWDGLGIHLMHGSRYLDRQLIKETGQGYSNAGAVCILKEAARQLIQEHSTQLVPQEQYEYYPKRLPDKYLNSNEIYMTQEAYRILEEFDDDCYLQDLLNDNQVSDGLALFLEEEIDKAFTKDPGERFMKKTINELHDVIDKFLSNIDLDNSIIK